MSKRAKRFFSNEFKKEILDQISRGEATVSQMAERNDLTVAMICRWRREMREGELDAKIERSPRVVEAGVDPKYVRHLEEKLRMANEKLGELYLVTEFLKKVDGEIRSTRNAGSLITSGNILGRSKRRVK